MSNVTKVKWLDVESFQSMSNMTLPIIIISLNKITFINATFQRCYNPIRTDRYILTSPLRNQGGISYVDLFYFVIVFAILSCLSHAALWSPAGKGLTSCLSCICFIGYLSLSYTVSWVRCGNWLNRLLIFAFFPTSHIGYWYFSTYERVQMSNLVKEIAARPMDFTFYLEVPKVRIIGR